MLELPHEREVAEDSDDAQVLALAALERRRAQLDRDRAPIPTPERQGHARDRCVAGERLHEDVAQLWGVREGLAAVPPRDLALEEAGEQLGGRVEGHHPPVQVHRDDAVRERGQDVVGVRLEIDQLDNVPLELGIRVLERPALLNELHGHVVERRGEPPDLVGGRRLDALRQLASRDGRRALGEPLYRARDASGHERRREAAQQEHDERERAELEPGPADLRLHPLLGESDADRAPLPPFHLHRNGEVVDRLAPRRHGLLDQELARQGRPPVDEPFQHGADALGVPAVGGHPAVGVQHEGIDHVGLARDPGDVLLERGVVVEKQWPVGDRREVTRDDLAAPLHLRDDRGALPVIDHDHDGRHDERDHEQRAQEELGAE